MGFANMLAPSFKNLPESLSTPVALELSIFVIIFKTFSSEVLLKQKYSEIVKVECYLSTDCKLYLSGGFASLIRRDFAKFENKFLKSTMRPCTCKVNLAFFIIVVNYTAQKVKFSIKDFFSKCDQISSILRIWSHLLNKSVMENFIFCAVLVLFFGKQQL